MEELQVIVNQKPGVIQWNFEDLKKALSDELAEYENMVYDDNAIAMAKKDVASLRKLRKSVDDRRKEIKTRCLEPYEVIESQAKELTGLIDKPIGLIAGQIEDYETAQRQARKENIIKYMADAFSDLPQEIRKKAQLATYDARWENKTASESEWKDAIQTEHDQIATALGVIDGVDEDFKEAARKVYQENLSLPDAMAKVQELQHQKEMLIERQRQREEEQKRREAEAAARAAQEAQKNESEEPGAVKNTQLQNHARTTQNIELQPQPEPRRNSPQPQNGPKISAILYLLDADDAQVKKVLDYIRFMGIKCEVRK